MGVLFQNLPWQTVKEVDLNCEMKLSIDLLTWFGFTLIAGSHCSPYNITITIICQCYCLAIASTEHCELALLGMS